MALVLDVDGGGEAMVLQVLRMWRCLVDDRLGGCSHLLLLLAVFAHLFLIAPLVVGRLLLVVAAL